MSVAGTILKQLGGNKFITMTGSKNFISDDYSLRMNLSRNDSGANRLEISLNSMDTYDLHFYRQTTSRKTFETKITTKSKVEGVYNDQLQKIFTDVTKLYTRL